MFKKNLKTIIILGENKGLVAETLFGVLSKEFKVKRVQGKVGFVLEDVLIIESELEELESFESLIKKSKKSILVLTSFGAESLEEIESVVDSFDFLILDSDDKELKTKIGKVETEKLTFGLEEGADFQATEIHQEGDTNFKIKHKSNIIPFWLTGITEDKKIYAVLATCVVGEILGVNLIKISEALREQ